MGKKSKRLIYGLGALQAFIGIGAVGGGLGLILEPSGANFGMPLEMLKHSPFTNFLIPGMVLLVVNGLGSLAGSVASFKQFRYAGQIAIVLGLYLILWIAIQVWWVKGIHWLHVLYFCLGLIEHVLGWLVMKAKSMLPPDDWRRKPT